MTFAMGAGSYRTARTKGTTEASYEKRPAAVGFPLPPRFGSPGQLFAFGSPGQLFAFGSPSQLFAFGSPSQLFAFGSPGQLPRSTRPPSVVFGICYAPRQR
jgi:hypothetical protein